MNNFFNDINNKNNINLIEKIWKNYPEEYLQILEDIEFILNHFCNDENFGFSVRSFSRNWELLFNFKNIQNSNLFGKPIDKKNYFGFNYQHVHFKKCKEILYFLKTNKIIRSYVLKKLPDFISDNIEKMFKNNFKLFKTLKLNSEQEERMGISNFIQKNFLNNDQKSNNLESYIMAGQIKFENKNLKENFKTLNIRNYIENQALFERWVNKINPPQSNQKRQCSSHHHLDRHASHNQHVTTGILARNMSQQRRRKTGN